MHQFAFRVDASPEIGIGHLMRCLTLADALRDRGAQCHFLSRGHPGPYTDRVIRAGHGVHALKSGARRSPAAPSGPGHAAWLGTDWRADAEEVRDILASIEPDWLVVDHYALDEAWERLVRPRCRRIAVIDDLVDRPHDCDLLLDQTLGRAPEAYRSLVPERCELFTGASHALLRREFAELRAASLARRSAQPSLRNLLVTMGGIDQANATERVLEALARCALPTDCRITVVMGASAPWLDSVRARASSMPWPARVLVDVTDMATLLSETDLSIGAPGTTSWERCCLGVPALLLVLAENQRHNASALEAAGAAVVLKERAPSLASIASALDGLLHQERLRSMSDAASRITSGRGAGRLADHLLNPS